MLLPGRQLRLKTLRIRGGLIKGSRCLHQQLVLDIVATDLSMILLNDRRVLLGLKLFIGMVGQV